MKGLKERVADGDTIVVAEGYVLEIGRRGFLSEGPYIPFVIMEQPDMIKSIHREFAHAGSDIVVACIYYLNRKKLREEGLEEAFEAMNRRGLELAKEVAQETGTLAAGNLFNSTDYDSSKPETVQAVRAMFKEQVEFALDAKMDLMILESFREFSEAMLALEVVQEVAPDMPTVVTLAPHHEKTLDGLEFGEALQKLKDAGATIVGLNCAQGPGTIIDTAVKVRQTYKAGHNERESLKRMEWNDMPAIPQPKPKPV